MAPPTKTSRRKNGRASLEKAEAALKEYAASFPEVHEDFPWGHSAFKVRKKKAFLFMATAGGDLSLSVKLPHSAPMALMMPFAAPTGYGLAKSGWVTATFPPGEDPPLGVLRAWIDESFRAVAPKTLVASMAAGAGLVVRPKTKRPARTRA